MSASNAHIYRLSTQPHACPGSLPNTVVKCSIKVHTLVKQNAKSVSSIANHKIKTRMMIEQKRKRRMISIAYYVSLQKRKEKVKRK